MAQKHVIEVVIDEEQLLSELLMEDTGNQLQDSLLHGSACPIQLLFKAGQVTTHKGHTTAEHSQIWNSDWNTDSRGYWDLSGTADGQQIFGVRGKLSLSFKWNNCMLFVLHITQKERPLGTTNSLVK